jgi:hypothetical protein
LIIVAPAPASVLSISANRYDMARMLGERGYA